MPIEVEDEDNSSPSEDPPEGAPQSGNEATDGESDYPSSVNFRVRDVYLANINGPALHVGANSASADIVVENINIDGAGYGIIADGVNVIARDCHIVADQPFGTVNGGSIEEENVATGSDANPTVPSNVPQSPEEAAGSNTQL